MQNWQTIPMDLRQYRRRVLLAGACMSLVIGASGCRRAQSATQNKLVAAEGAAPAGSATSILPTPSSPADRANLGDIKSSGVADIVERVVPSVVSIASTRVTHSRQSPHNDPFFRFFFGPGGGPREQPEQGLGSGVIVGDGIVVTNNHVVDQADNIKVATLDEREFDAKLVGSDPKSDLAVLRLSGATSGLKALPLGDAEHLRLGDVVLAIGNPFGVGQTVTMGIVSAKNRSDLGIEDYEDFIQTDAAINPGNSGGALVDLGGNLVGINTAILSRSGGNVGIGFAIPANMARPIVESLITRGKVFRGWLGVAIQRLDYDMAKALHVSENSGVLVSDVTNGSPAAKAGVKRGDVITSVDDHKVRTTGELRNAIATAGVNHTAHLKLLRDGRDIALSVALAALPATLEEKGGETSAPGEPSSRDLEMQLQPLTPELRRQLEVPAEITSGLVVADLDPMSDAARSGIRTGDVIVEVDRKRITTAAELRRIWQGAQGNLLVLVLRKGSTAYIVIKHAS